MPRRNQEDGVREPDTGAQALAEAASESMYTRDAASRGLGMRITAIGPGNAALAMTVRGDMLNGHRTCHGGLIFALADSAFAFACNSRNLSTVAAGCQIDYLAPAFEGDSLTAVANEQALKGRTGVYDVAVTNQTGALIALFRGKSHRVGGEVLELRRDEETE